MAIDQSKIFLYTLTLLSLLVQTTARRSELLPLPNDTTTIPSSNDIQPILKNDNNTTTSPSEINDTPTSTTNNTTIPKRNKNENESIDINDEKNDTPTTIETNDNQNSTPSKETTPNPSPPQQNSAEPPYVQQASQTSQEYNKDDVVLTPSSPPPSLDLDNDYQNDNDMPFFSPLNSPSPAPSYDTSDDVFSDYENSPKASPEAFVSSDEYENGGSTIPAEKPRLVPANYEAEDEVDAELAAEINAYAAELERQKKSGTVMVVVGCVCLVGVGGLIYKKRKQDVNKSQYQYLNKKEDN